MGQHFQHKTIAPFIAWTHIEGLFTSFFYLRSSKCSLTAHLEMTISHSGPCANIMDCPFHSGPCANIMDCPFHSGPCANIMDCPFHSELCANIMDSPFHSGP
ncbi:hypothetical protein CHS0354_024554 [Potamilus streckersoni]|uniref:Uncharacterized protein n=1 Tax=Potamilus streckersoni TaxID=2493646 RepID=A0AAE0TLS7_9BIVA|nr:hypothetical protein CHS0354_024554 [Potamilus streckersoni]